MPQLRPYLSFDGNCVEAMRAYERILGGRIKVLMTNAQTPVAEHIPPGNEDRIMHAMLESDGLVIMAGDAFAGQPYEPMKGFNLALSFESADRAREVFDALAEGGKVTMPFGPVFWSEVSGMLRAMPSFENQ